MKSYGQFCPISKAAEIFCERWTALIIRNIAVGANRFSDIQRGVPLMSATLLSQRLKTLEAEGIIERRKAEGRQRWSYHLTERGAEFVPMVEALGVWGRRWSRRRLAENEVDFGLLIWGLEYTVDASAFGDRRTNIQMEFNNQPSNKRRAWYVNDGVSVDLCLTDPGHDVDLLLSGRLEDFIYLYNGDVKLAAALESGQIDAEGAPRLLARLGTWFNFSPFGDVQAAMA